MLCCGAFKKIRERKRSETLVLCRHSTAVLRWIEHSNEEQTQIPANVCSACLLEVRMQLQ